MDTTPNEIETLVELRIWLDKRTLEGLAVQGLDLTGIDFTGVAVADALFLGCRIPAGLDAELVRRGAHVVPSFAHAPYPTHPNALYTPSDLTANFADGGYTGMYDTIVYQHFVNHGGHRHRDLRRSGCRSLPPGRTPYAIDCT